MKKYKDKKRVQWLDTLYYDIGKQATNFRICHNYFINGRKKFSRWINYLDSTIQERREATHRTLLKNEVVLDFDPRKGETRKDLKCRVKSCLKWIKKKKISYKCYDTGSRGYHVHIFLERMFFMNSEKRRTARTNIARYFGAELQKNSENVTIALEGVSHWKSGKKKKEVNLI